MIEQNIQVIGIEQRILRRLAEKVLRMGHNELVDRCAGRHHHRQAGSLPPARAPSLLPGAGNGAWIAAEHASRKRSDINAQLQRIGGYHGINAPGPKPLFNFPTLTGQIAAPVPPYAPAVAHRIAYQVL